MAQGFSLPGSAEPPNRQTRHVLGHHKAGYQKYFLKECHISYFILIYILHLSDSALCLGPTRVLFLGAQNLPQQLLLVRIVCEPVTVLEGTEDKKFLSPKCLTLHFTYIIPAGG